MFLASLALAGRFFTTAPPAMPSITVLLSNFRIYLLPLRETSYPSAATPHLPSTPLPWKPDLLSVYGFASFGHCLQWSHTVVVFCDWLLSLSTVSSRLMLWHVSVQFSSVAQSCPILCDPIFHSFLWSNNIRLYGYIHILFVYSSVDRHLGCFSFLAIMHITVVNIDVQVFVWLCFDFSWVYL